MLESVALRGLSRFAKLRNPLRTAKVRTRDCVSYFSRSVVLYFDFRNDVATTSIISGILKNFSSINFTYRDVRQGVGCSQSPLALKVMQSKNILAVKPSDQDAYIIIREAI